MSSPHLRILAALVGASERPSAVMPIARSGLRRGILKSTSSFKPSWAGHAVNDLSVPINN
jgi:hypothetical protein